MLWAIPTFKQDAFWRIDRHVVAERMTKALKLIQSRYFVTFPPTDVLNV